MAKIIIISDPPDDGTGHRSTTEETGATVKVEGLTNEQATQIAQYAVQVAGGTIEP